MKQSNTVTVNGHEYDTKTGMPITASQTPSKLAPATKVKPAAAAAAPPRPVRGGSTDIHRVSPQRTKTLRRPTPKPTIPPKSKMTSDVNPPSAIKTARRNPKALDVTPHPGVKKFATPTPKNTKKPATSADIAPRKHPHVLRTEQRLAQKKQVNPTPTSSKQKKEVAITKALNSASKPVTPKHTKKPRASRPRKTLRTLSTIGVVIIILAVVLWVSLPAISVRIAAAQAGITATTPHYIPDGYTLSLPLETNDGRVAMRYTSNQNSSSFTISQEKSTWDSQSVRQMVEERSGSQFLTSQDRGLTIYTYDGNAAWVNRGLLYQISGDARLSGDTITRIAASL